mmetsp:Transcript_15987/g.49944  ORF Transcript_15987/g.49944 Transcript_15987/m.49944 type:complete len:277 (+) Transcript_15987:1495-2325(+)
MTPTAARANPCSGTNTTRCQISSNNTATSSFVACKGDFRVERSAVILESDQVKMSSECERKSRAGSGADNRWAASREEEGLAESTPSSASTGEGEGGAARSQSPSRSRSRSQLRSHSLGPTCPGLSLPCARAVTVCRTVLPRRLTNLPTARTIGPTVDTIVASLISVPLSRPLACLCGRSIDWCSQATLASQAAGGIDSPSSNSDSDSETVRHVTLGLARPSERQQLKESGRTCGTDGATYSTIFSFLRFFAGFFARPMIIFVDSSVNEGMAMSEE